ncbi:MAG: cytochrome P450 [Pseudomonadota bacterium]
MGFASVDLLDDEVVQDPYPLYATLRRDAPVCALSGGGFLLTRHADVTAALAHPALGNAPSRFSVLHESKAARYEVARLAGNILPFQDPPTHTRNRRQLLAAYGPSAAAVSQGLSAYAEESIDALRGRRAFDLVTDFGRPFAARVMRAFLGVASQDEARWLAGSEAFFRLFAPFSDPRTLNEVNAELSSFRSLVARTVETKIADEVGGFATAMRAADADQPADIQTIADSAILLFADGVENVQFAIAGIWALLAERPDITTRFSAEPALLAEAVEEALRLHAPAQSVPRIASELIDWLGVAIKPGTPVFLSIGSANRDPGAFSNADALRVGDASAKGRALTFGAGRHSCIGGRLAADMTRVGVEALWRAGVKPSTSFSALRFLPRFGHRWPARVPAVFSNGQVTA